MPIRTKYWTLAELKAKVAADLDLKFDSSEEAFITTSEINGYINEGIDRAEMLIHSIYEDYFLTRSNIPIVADTEEYALPMGIWGMKIRRIIFTDGTTTYEIPRIRDWKKFENMEAGFTTSSSGSYSYIILKSNLPTVENTNEIVSGNHKIVLSPKPQTNGNMKVWYLSQARELVNESDVLDIPEAHQMIVAFAKVKCLEKEKNEGLASAVENLASIVSNFEAMLYNMVPDTNNEIEPDYSGYGEMV